MANGDRADKRILREKVLALRANPIIQSNAQIAQILGVSRQAVARHVSSVQTAIKASNDALALYGKELKTSMPIADRAKTLVDLAKNGKQELVRLKAIERMDDLDGITTEKDRLRAINLGEGAQQQGPMFLMAPGSTVQVLAKPRREPKASTTQHPQDVVVSNDDDHN